MTALSSIAFDRTAAEASLMICVDGSVGPLLIVGGGTTGLRKIRTLLDAGMKVTLISPNALPELESLVHEGRIAWSKRFAERRDFEEHSFALLALPRAATETVLPLAEGTRCLLNCCGAPEHGAWSLAAQFCVSLPRETRRELQSPTVEDILKTVYSEPDEDELSSAAGEGVLSSATDGGELLQVKNPSEEKCNAFSRSSKSPGADERARDDSSLFLVGVASGGRSPGGSAALKRRLREFLEGETP